jgi:hypothetical protein
MNQNLKQIDKVLSLDFNLDEFYVIRIYNHIIHLQGEHNENIQTQCEKLGYEFKISDLRFLVANKDGIEITLVTE